LSIIKTASWALAFDANTATPKAKAAKARITSVIDPPSLINQACRSALPNRGDGDESPSLRQLH
jgi:hypothetical protein